jgi:hypothetical protein
MPFGVEPNNLRNVDLVELGTSPWHLLPFQMLEHGRPMDAVGGCQILDRGTV